MKIALVTFHDESCTGLRILASCLKKENYDVRFIILKEHKYKRVESFNNSNSCHIRICSNGYIMAMNDVNPISDTEKELFFSYLQQEQPDIVGLSFRSYLNPVIIELIPQIRTILPETKIICGGFGPTLEPELFTPYADAVLRGEGEETIVEFCNAVKNNTDFRSIMNVSYNDENNVCINNKLRCPENNISKYPWPFNYNSGEENFAFIENNTLLKIDPLKHNWKSYVMLLGRGCVGSCSYCSGGNWIKQYSNYGYNVSIHRLRDIDDAIGELKQAKADGFKKIYFTDEFFVAPISYFKEFLDRYEREINLPCWMYLHYQQMLNHPDIFERLVNLGLELPIVGIQHGDENFAKTIYNRKNSHESYLKFIDMAHKYGLGVGLHIIHGTNLDTEESFRNSLNFLKKIPFIKGKDIINCFRLTPLPKTPLLEKYKNLKVLPLHEFERQGCLTVLRMFLDDEEFMPLLNNPLYYNDPTELKEIYLKTIQEYGLY